MRSAAAISRIMNQQTTHVVLQAEIAATLSAAGIKDVSEWDTIEASSMACPAMPMCGLAVTEAERSLPDINARIRALCTKVSSNLACRVVHKASPASICSALVRPAPRLCPLTQACAASSQGKGTPRVSSVSLLTTPLPNPRTLVVVWQRAFKWDF